jgi:hypothetical protein
MSKAKRYAVTAVCYIICAPILPIYLLWAMLSGAEQFISWTMQDRPWSVWFIDRAERFAARHGVTL